MMPDESSASSFDDGPGVALAHDSPARIPLLVAPASAEQVNMIRLRPVPIACARLNRTGFDFDSSLVTPAIVPALQRLGGAIDRNPGAPLSVFGHADPVGDDAYNKQLAGRRAIAVYALLTRRTDLWEQLYSSPMGGDDWHKGSLRIMLGHVRNTEGAPYLGASAGSMFDAARAFQADHGLTTDGVVGPKTRKELFSAYMNAICIDGDGTPYEVAADRFLDEGKDSGGQGAYQGCGELNPVFLFSRADAGTPAYGKAKEERDAQNGINRRVMIFFFRPGTRIPAGRWPCPRASEDGSACRAQLWPDGEQRRTPSDEPREYRKSRDTMACRFYDGFARRSPCEGVLTTTLEIKLYDDEVRLLPDARYRVTVESDVRTGTAGDGTLRLKRVAVPSTCLVEWNPASGPTLTKTLGAARFQMTLFLNVDSPGKEGRASRMLHNIGYPVEQGLSASVLTFQRDEGLPGTGELDEPTEKRLDEVYRALSGGSPDGGGGAAA